MRGSIREVGVLVFWCFIWLKEGDKVILVFFGGKFFYGNLVLFLICNVFLLKGNIVDGVW